MSAAVAPTAPGPAPRTRAPGPSIGHGPTSPPVDSGAALRSQRWGTLVCLNRDGSQGAEYPLAGEFVDVGADGQVRFEDPFLAPRHLRLWREGEVLYAIPLDRINGTFIRLTEQTKLESKATLLLGRELLLYETLPAEEVEIEQAIQHGVHIFGSPVRDAWGRLDQVLPNGCVRDIRHLIGVEVIIGREEGDVVFADDEFLSRRHASLHWRDGACFMQDLGSSNGSFLRIRKRTQLTSGTQLRFGDQMVRIDILV